jgi:hypothetical protein
MFGDYGFGNYGFGNYGRMWNIILISQILSSAIHRSGLQGAVLMLMGCLGGSQSAAGNLPAVDKMVGPAPSFDVGYAGLVFDIAQHRATRKGLVQ